MKCKNCAFCVQEKKYSTTVICSNGGLLEGLNLHDRYEEIKKPSYCAYYADNKTISNFLLKE